MENRPPHNPTCRQSKGSESLTQLKAYVRQSKYIDISEQPKICASFGLPYMVSVFRDEYRKRFFEYLQTHTTTVATVSEETLIPHKYLCQVKASLESKELLQVVSFRKCPTTGSSNVQFVTTNPKLFKSSDQLKLF
jgi:hypothetical protein